MPTGYTADVVNGKITEFRSFALQCARAFGALVDMRDDPWDKPIPDAIEPSSYYATALAEAKEHLNRLQALTPQQADERALAAYNAAVAARNCRVDAARQEDARLEAMLTEVRAWTPPTADHVAMKDFMIQQLTDSKNGDVTRWHSVPEKLTRQDWLQREIKQAFESLGRAAEAHAREVARAEGRTRWIQALKASLGEETYAKP